MENIVHLDYMTDFRIVIGYDDDPDGGLMNQRKADTIAAATKTIITQTERGDATRFTIEADNEEKLEHAVSMFFEDQHPMRIGKGSAYSVVERVMDKGTILKRLRFQPWRGKYFHTKKGYLDAILRGLDPE